MVILLNNSKLVLDFIQTIPNSWGNLFNLGLRCIGGSLMCLNSCICVFLLKLLVITYQDFVNAAYASIQ